MAEANKKLMNADELIVSTKVIAGILDLTTRRVNQMVEEGILEKVKTGSFKLVPTIRKYILFLKTKNDTEKSSTEDEYLLEHMLLEKAKREKAELEVALMKGTMHDGLDVEREMTKMLSAFRARVLSIPTKLAPKVVITKDVAGIEDMIRCDLYNALNELSDYDSKLFQHETYIELEDEVSIDGG